MITYIRSMGKEQNKICNLKLIRNIIPTVGTVLLEYLVYYSHILHLLFLKAPPHYLTHILALGQLALPPSPILTNLSLLQDLLVKTLIYYLLHSMLCCLNYFSWKMFQSLTIPMTLSSTALYKNLNLMSNFYLSIRLGTLGDLQPLILVSTRESVLLVSCGKTYCTHMYIQYVTFTPAVLDCYSCGVV